MAATDEITNYDDQLDSRDIQERIDYLYGIGDEMTGGELAEYKQLTKLKQEYIINYYGEDSWSFGAQFINDNYFEDYTQEFAEACGLVKEGLQWPNNCIDWEQAARELQMDYTEIDFNGVTYWTQEA